MVRQMTNVNAVVAAPSVRNAAAFAKVFLNGILNNETYALTPRLNINIKIKIIKNKIFILIPSFFYQGSVYMFLKHTRIIVDMITI